MSHRDRDDKPKDDWLCRTCTNKDGTQYKNFGSRKSCKLCTLHKRSCYGGPLFKPGTKDPAKHTAGPANKQVQQQMQQMQNMLEQAKKALKASNDKVKDLEKARPNEHTMEVDSSDYPDAAKQELQADIKYLEAAAKLAKEQGRDRFAESLEISLLEARKKFKDQLPASSKHQTAARKLAKANENSGKAEAALAKGKEALVEQQNKVAELITNLATRKMQEEQARADFLQTGAEQAGEGCMPVHTSSPNPTSFPDIDPKYWKAEGVPPELKAFFENGGTSYLKELWERQGADQKAEGERKFEEAQAEIMAGNQAKADAIAIATATATAAACNTEQQQGPIEFDDDEIIDDLLSPETLALLSSSDVIGRRAVWKQVVKTQGKKAQKRG